MSDTPRTDAALARFPEEGAFAIFPLMRELERELQAERQRCEDAENIGADKLLAELSRRGVNVDNWDGDEGLWPTLARCIVSYANEQAESRAASATALLRECRELLTFYSNEYALGDESGELAHWPKDEVERCREARDLCIKLDAATGEAG